MIKKIIIKKEILEKILNNIKNKFINNEEIIIIKRKLK